MITVGILVIGAVAYFGGWYGMSFWIVALATANGVLATGWSIINPDWYWRKAELAGMSPHEQFTSGRRSFVPSLLAAKVPLIAVMAVAGWYVGKKAGYF